MDTLTKRYLLFLIGCIGIRGLFVYIAKTINVAYLPYLGYLALLPALGFAYIYLSGSRQTGPEVFGEKIWWNNLRPVHAMLYGAFAVSAIYSKEYSWMFLLADVTIGLSGFLMHHFAL
jgi:hypothetical protein